MDTSEIATTITIGENTYTLEELVEFYDNALFQLHSLNDDYKEVNKKYVESIEDYNKLAAKYNNLLTRFNTLKDLFKKNECK